MACNGFLFWLTSGSLNEMIRYTPSTVFDPATMDVETIDGAPVDDQASEGIIVEHCLHVAILAYTMTGAVRGLRICSMSFGLWAGRAAWAGAVCRGEGEQGQL